MFCRCKDRALLPWGSSTTELELVFSLRQGVVSGLVEVLSTLAPKQGPPPPGPCIPRYLGSQSYLQSALPRRAPCSFPMMTPVVKCPPSCPPVTDSLPAFGGSYHQSGRYLSSRVINNNKALLLVLDSTHMTAGEPLPGSHNFHLLTADKAQHCRRPQRTTSVSLVPSSNSPPVLALSLIPAHLRLHKPYRSQSATCTALDTTDPSVPNRTDSTTLRGCLSDRLAA